MSKVNRRENYHLAHISYHMISLNHDPLVRQLHAPNSKHRRLCLEMTVRFVYVSTFRVCTSLKQVSEMDGIDFHCSRSSHDFPWDLKAIACIIQSPMISLFIISRQQQTQSLRKADPRPKNALNLLHMFFFFNTGAACAV